MKPQTKDTEGWKFFEPTLHFSTFEKNPNWRWWKFWQQPRFIPKELPKPRARYRQKGKIVTFKIDFEANND